MALMATFVMALVECQASQAFFHLQTIFLFDSVGEARYQRLTLWLCFRCLPFVF